MLCIEMFPKVGWGPMVRVRVRVRVRFRFKIRVRFRISRLKSPLGNI